MRSIKAVIFDLDGTLIDSTEAIVESYFHTFDTIGVERPSREAIIGGIGFTLEQSFARITQHPADVCVPIYRKYYARVCCAKTFLLPHADECLRALRGAGLALGIATSKRMDYAAKILDHLGVLHYFESRIGPDEVTHPKPHPEAVLKSMENLGTAPHETIFVGDMDFDVLAARAAGVDCYCLTTGYLSRSEIEALEPAAVCDSLDEVAERILSLVSEHAE